MKLRSPRALTVADLGVVEHWFDDPDTQRWLGDREWPQRLLMLTDQQNRHALVYCLCDEPVALLDVERYENSTASFAVVVSPAHRRTGLATSILRDMFALPETAGVHELFGEVEAGNQASERCLLAAGFEVTGDDREPGFIRYALRRDWPALGEHP